MALCAFSFLFGYFMVAWYGELHYDCDHYMYIVRSWRYIAYSC